MKKSFILIWLIVFIAGCFGGFPEVKKTGIIEGYIKDIITDETVPYIEVRLQDVVYETQADGRFPLVRGGDDPYIIPKDSGDSYKISDKVEDTTDVTTVKRETKYYEKSGVSIFTYGQKNLIGYVTPKADTTKKYMIAGKVFSGTALVSDADVVISGTFAGESYKTKTDINGVFSVSEIPKSYINIYIYKNDYKSYSKIINLTEDYVNEQIQLAEESGRKYGDITGQVAGFNNEVCGYSIVSWGVRGSSDYQFCIADSFGSYTLYGIPEG